MREPPTLATTANKRLIKYSTSDTSSLLPDWRKGSVCKYSIFSSERQTPPAGGNPTQTVKQLEKMGYLTVSAGCRNQKSDREEITIGALFGGCSPASRAADHPRKINDLPSLYVDLIVNQ
jgi:hypothetical protein